MQNTLAPCWHGVGRGRAVGIQDYSKYGFDQAHTLLSSHVLWAPNKGPQCRIEVYRSLHLPNGYHGLVVHRIRDDKSKDTFKALMDGYKGTVVCDALKTHEAGARGNDAIALAGCWAHVYRKFEDAMVDHPEAGLALKWIGQIYAIDDRAESDLGKRPPAKQIEAVAPTLASSIRTRPFGGKKSMSRALRPTTWTYITGSLVKPFSAPGSRPVPIRWACVER
jgi:hypothetical protein